MPSLAALSPSMIRCERRFRLLPVAVRTTLAPLILFFGLQCATNIATADDAKDFEQLLQRSKAEFSAGKYREMEVTALELRRLAESSLADKPQCLATALNDLGIATQYQRRFAEAEPILQQSLKIRESKLGPDHLHVAKSLNNLAYLYYQMRQYARAEPLYQQALKIREAKLGPDHPDVVSTLNGLAATLYGMSRYPEAEPFYQRILKIRESTLGPDHLDVAKSLNTLAALYDRMGQCERAEPLYHRSLKIMQAKLGPDHLDVGASLNSLAAVYAHMGQYKQAEPLFERSLKIKEAKLGPDHSDVAASLNSLAIVYGEMGNYNKAEPLLQRSLKITEARFGPDHPSVATSLGNLAVLYDRMGQYDRAEPLYQQSLKIKEAKLGSDHPSVAISLQNLALRYVNMGNYTKAEPLYQRSLKIREGKLGLDHPYVSGGRCNLARLCAATARWQDAAYQIEIGQRSIRRHAARTLPALSDKEQLSFLQRNYRLDYYTALSLALNQRDDARTAQLSTGWILNGKAIVQEVLAQRSLLVAEGHDPALSDLVKQLLALRSRLASLSLTMPKTGHEAAYSEELNTLNEQEQELSRQLRRATGRKETGDPWVELADVQKAIAKNALLVEIARYYRFDFNAKGTQNNWRSPRYAAWLIPAEGQGETTIIDLGEARPIDDAVQTARNALGVSEKAIRDDGEAEAEKQLRESMRDLAKLVLEPLEKHFGDARQLIVSPDAALWLVPWGALPVADGKYAVEKYQIRYVISGRDLVSQAETKGQPLNNPILFANPDYDLAPTDVEATTRAILRSAAPVEQVASSRGLGSLGSLPRVGRLPGTAEEAAAIKPNVARYAGTDAVLYEDQNALEGVFKVIHSPQVLVLSTHGFFMPDQEVATKEARSTGAMDDGSKSQAAVTTEGKPLENPLLRCGLLLAGCNQRVEDAPAGVDDGILTGLEIVGTDLRGTELVVLSACETGLGQIRNGEGVAGLRQAFQLAGAKAVVSTLWQIPDTETVDLMNAFFANLSSGQSKADALRNAQMAQIKARRESKSAAHPYYWAAFTLTGQ